MDVTNLEHREYAEVAPKLGDYFSYTDRELLILLCKNRNEVATAFFPSSSDCRDRVRLEGAMEQLLELIKLEEMQSTTK